MKVKIFVSYCHQDEAYLAEDSLLGFLKGLEREDLEFWWDGRIAVGVAWDEQIKARISESQVALVLVSQAFLDSEYCSNVEIGEFLRLNKDRGLIIFPVILSACEWSRTNWLQARQFIPVGGETIEEQYTDPGRRKRLFLEIRQELRDCVERVRSAATVRETQALDKLEERRLPPVSSTVGSRSEGAVRDPAPGRTLIHVQFTLITPDGLRRIAFELKKDAEDDGSVRWRILFQLFERDGKAGEFGDAIVDLVVDVDSELSPKAQAMAMNGMTLPQAAFAMGPAADAAKDSNVSDRAKQAMIQSTLNE